MGEKTLSVLSQMKPVLKNDECTVTGIHAFVLRMSSIFGLAPLRFKSLGNGYTVSFSNSMYIYSYLLVTVLAVIALFGITSEMMLGFAPSVYMSCLASQVMFGCDVIWVTMMVCVGVYGAPRRMRSMLEFMKIVASVDKSIGPLYDYSKERKHWAAVISFMVYFCVLIVLDSLYYLVRSGTVTRALDFVVQHLFWFLITSLDLQFAFTVMAVQMRFKAVNEALALTARHLSIPNVQKSKCSEAPNIFATKVAPIECQLEDATAIVKKSVIGELRLAVSPCEAVYRIASLHGALSDVVHRIDRRYGFAMIVILISLLLHLIVTPYFTLLEISGISMRIYRNASLYGALSNVVNCLNGSYSIDMIVILISFLLHLIVTPYFTLLEINAAGPHSGKLFITLEALWILLQVLRLLMVVEPCHYTVVENKKTENFIARMILESPTTGPLPARLELFSRQLMLQSLSYNPMDLCTLDRPLIASIFGAVATYLVILIQFYSLDK